MEVRGTSRRKDPIPQTENRIAKISALEAFMRSSGLNALQIARAVGIHRSNVYNFLALRSDMVLCNWEKLEALLERAGFDWRDYRNAA